MLPVRVIHLARDVGRRAEFERRNAHLAASFVDAVDGSALSAEAIATSGLFTAEIRETYTPHAYGTTISHWRLWNEAAAGRGPVTIAEDDAVFRRDFEARAAAVLASLPQDWDIVLWGWNFDSVLAVRPMGAVTPVVMLFEQDEMRRSIDTFQSLATPVQAFELQKAFGTLAYTVSPAGAARLIERCFPQRAQLVFLPVYGRWLRNVGLDVSMNAAYAGLRSFACFPPLAVSPNVRGS